LAMFLVYKVFSATLGLDEFFVICFSANNKRINSDN
jgi:hypothetical protein